MERNARQPRVAFQGEPGAFSEAAVMQLLGASVRTVPCATFEAAFHSIVEGKADALLAPVENSLAGSVVRVFDLLLESRLEIVAETILHVEHQLIGCPGATLRGLRSVASHPVALAQCERFFAAHPGLKRVPAEDTAGSVREVLASGDRSVAAIAGRRAAEHYGGVILAENIHDNAENFTRFVLLIPATPESTSRFDWTNGMPDRTQVLTAPEGELLRGLWSKREAKSGPATLKMSLSLRLAHAPGSLLAALEPFARHGVNLLKIESRPIHGHPWEYQFFLDVEAGEAREGESGIAAAISRSANKLNQAAEAVRAVSSELRVLGVYPPSR